jgi:chemotaxis protein methyltransferase CheR
MPFENSLVLNKFESIDSADIDKIAVLLQELYGYDIHKFAGTFKSRRIVYSMQKHKVRDVNELSVRLRNTDFYEQFLSDLIITGVEFFRDSIVWETIADIIIDSYSKNRSCKVWFPDCANGEELYSFIIMLHEYGLQENCFVTATTLSNDTMNIIKKGYYEGKSEKIDIANYNKLPFPSPASNYFKCNDNSLQLQSNLLDDVLFTRPESINPLKDSFDMVIYRNVLLQYNAAYHKERVQQIYRNMTPDGFLIIGINEQMLVPETMFTVYNKENKIYQKSIV